MRFIVAILLLCATSILPAVTFLLPSDVLAYTSLGKPTGFVNDFAKVISADEKVALEEKLSAFEKETGNEIVVVTINELVDETVESYAVKLFEEWGIGKADKDTGALILVSIADRAVRIEVGYGLEPYITDAISTRIIRDVIAPNFQAGDYDAGVAGAVDKIIGVFNGTEDLSGDRMGGGVNGGLSGIFSGLFGELLPFLIIVLLNLIPVIIYSKSWWLGGVVGFILGFIVFSSFFAAGIVALIGLIIDFILSKIFGGKGPKSGGPGGMGGVWFGGLGGRGGSGFGGGFGGFGGGMSGGGGSSGRW